MVQSLPGRVEENMKNLALITFLTLIVAVLSEFASITPQVVNGTNADVAEFPYMVSLRRLEQPYCGATMLSEWWLLTVICCTENNLAR